jgi:cobalt-zinc-cadmium resistance protein CzcA
MTPKPISLVLLALFSISSIQAQEQHGVNVQLAQLLERALEYHPKIKAQEKLLIGSKAELGSALNLPKTEVYRNVDQNNITQKGSVLELIGISQNFSFPTVYMARKKWLSTAYQKEQWNAWLNRNQALFEVSEAYYRLLVYNELIVLNEQRVETFQEYVRVAKLRIEVGESTELELLNAQSVLQKAQNELLEYQSIAQIAISDLKRYTNLEDLSEPFGTLVRESLPEEIDRASLRALVEAEIAVFESQWKMVKQDFAPEVSLDVFRGVDPADQKVYDGIQVGVALPIFYQTQKAKSLRAKSSYEASKILLNDRLTQKLAELEVTWSLLQQEKRWMDQYENEMKLTFEAVMRLGLKSYQSGNLSSIEFSEVLNSAYELKVQYLNRFLSYHNHLLQLKYLTI